MAKRIDPIATPIRSWTDDISRGQRDVQVLLALTPKGKSATVLTGEIQVLSLGQVIAALKRLQLDGMAIKTASGWRKP
jgi:hypothetical protein